MTRRRTDATREKVQRNAKQTLRERRREKTGKETTSFCIFWGDRGR